jgi:hypothetical protein
VVGDAGDVISAAWEDSALHDVLAPGFESFQEWMRENDAWIGQVVDVLENVSAVLAVLSLVVPGLAGALATLAGVLALVAVLRAMSGTVTWGDAALSTVSLAALGAGAAVIRPAGRATQAVAAGRVEGLVSSGLSPRLATSWVQTSFERARPSFGDTFLLRSLGDEEVAQMLHFLRSSRPGAFADDAAAVSGIRRRLFTVQLINGAAFAWSSFGAAQKMTTSLQAPRPVIEGAR